MNPIHLKIKNISSEEYEMQQDVIKYANYTNPACKYFDNNYEYSLIGIKQINNEYQYKFLLKNENTEYIRTFIGKTSKDKIRLFLKFKGKTLLINSLAIIGGLEAIFNIIKSLLVS